MLLEFFPCKLVFPPHSVSKEMLPANQMGLIVSIVVKIIILLVNARAPLLIVLV